MKRSGAAADLSCTFSRRCVLVILQPARVRVQDIPGREPHYDADAAEFRASLGPQATLVASAKLGGRRERPPWKLTLSGGDGADRFASSRPPTSSFLAPAALD